MQITNTTYTNIEKIKDDFNSQSYCKLLGINVINIDEDKQVNDDIRNYRVIHWQIASVLYLLMVGIIGYGLPNIGEEGKGYIICSALLIFILHVTTYCYFEMLCKLKKDKREKIINKINYIDIMLYLSGENHDERSWPSKFLDRNCEKIGQRVNTLFSRKSNNKKLCWFWRIHS